MKRTFPISVWMTVALLVTLAAAATEYKDQNFQLNLPAAFGAPAKATASASGIETETWVSKATTGEAVVVSMSKMPAKITDPVKVMDSTRDSLLKSLKGTLESEQNVPSDMPSRVLVFKTANAFLRSRLVVDNDRLYQLLYVGRSDQQRADPAVLQMFDSFKITAPPMTSNSTTTMPAPAATTTASATTTVTTTTIQPTPPPPPKPPQR